MPTREKTVRLNVDTGNSEIAFAEIAKAFNETPEDELLARSGSAAPPDIEDVIDRMNVSALQHFINVLKIRLFPKWQQYLAIKATYEALCTDQHEANTELQYMHDCLNADKLRVSDVILMSSASRLMQMGIASDAHTAAHFTQYAIRAGHKMGHDAQTSAEGFALMVANLSMLRLEDFGISVAEFRKRFNAARETDAALDKYGAFIKVLLEMINEAP